MSWFLGDSLLSLARPFRGGLFVALGLAGLVSAQSLGGLPPQGKGEGEHKASRLSTPILRALSVEVEQLKRSVDYQAGMWLYSGKGRFFHHGIHLGHGLIAAPYSEELKPGDCGFAYFKRGKYRVLHIGSDRPFVSFFRLPDRVALDRLPIPKLPTPLGKGEEPGNLVVLVGPLGETRLSFLPHLPRFGMSRRGSRPSGKGVSRVSRRRSPFGFFGFILPGESVPGGSVALNPKGEFLGMAVRGPERRRGINPRKRLRGPSGLDPTQHGPNQPVPNRHGPKPGSASARDSSSKEQRTRPSSAPGPKLRPRASRRGDRRDSAWGAYSVVLSQRILMGRAERWSQKTKDLLPNRILLGISLDWRRAKKDQGAGIVVTGLFPGAPASQAGIQVGDRLLRFGSKTIQSRKDLQEALANHKVGEVVPVLLRRGKRELPVQIHLN
ncbi:MAG TPA: PDZ domain-containing protein [Planctomycetes bacterium]|nr:PDZ domain-containing protein [Planctomycetota bacterium]